MKEEANRKTGIELLRIIVTFGVIFLHYNNPNAGKAFLYAEGISSYILYYIESLFICAVNVFILISGYFMCKNNNRTLLKPVQLIIQVIIISFGFYVYRVVIDVEKCSIKSLCSSLLPDNYFIILYIVLYVVSPYINIMFNHLGERERKKCVNILFLLFSVWPTLIDVVSELFNKNLGGLNSIGLYGSQWGYSIINFILLYIIGSYLRLNEQKQKKSSQIIMSILLLSGILVVWEKINLIYGGKSAWSYCNPIVIIEAILWFELFLNIKINYSKWINWLAKASLTVYLLHGYFLGYIHIEVFVKKTPLVMCGHMLLSAAMIYLICFICYNIYERLMFPIFKLLNNNVSILNKQIIGGNR